MEDGLHIDFEIEASEDRTHVVVRIGGEIDVTSAPQIEEVAAVVAGWPGTAQIVIDLSSVTFLDSSGISVLLRCSEECANLGIEFVAEGAHGLPLTVLEIAGVLPYLAEPAATTSG